MKRVPTYSLTFLLLLFASCEEQEPIIGNTSIIEFLTEVEQAKTTRSWTGEKTVFENGDTIYVFGSAKTSSGGTGVRFMPADDDSTGAAYISDNRDVLGWHRFKASGSDIGLWRDGFYHDFTAYYYTPKFETKNQTFTMDSLGLPPKELLWGETKNVFFNGNAIVIPKITFKHQLSRIRIKVIHDMAPEDALSFAISKIAFNLNNSSADFNVETGQWSSGFGGPIGIELFPDTTLVDITRLESTDIIECWVLPNKEISDFYVTLEGTLDPILVPFIHNSDPSVKNVITKPGYITELQLEFGDIRTIIFTVSLMPWEKVREERDITDE